MGPTGSKSSGEKFLADVRRLLADRIARMAAALDGFEVRRMKSGKMLRSRLAARLVEQAVAGPGRPNLVKLAAAVELVHTASLCHDDVIDNGLLRRGNLTLWQTTGASGAVLIGDLFLCEAMELLQTVDGGQRVPPFLAKVREVVEAEVEQELLLRGRELDEATCLRLARQKTGPLFAFAAAVCGGGDAELSAALEEAGYRLGAAYQLADDLLDHVGDEDEAGKTLGTDALRRKFTLAQSPGGDLKQHVHDLCTSAAGCVAAWPEASKAVHTYLVRDIGPVLQRLLGSKLAPWKEPVT